MCARDVTILQTTTYTTIKFLPVASRNDLRFFFPTASPLNCMGKESMLLINYLKPTRVIPAEKLPMVILSFAREIYSQSSVPMATAII